MSDRYRAATFHAVVMMTSIVSIAVAAPTTHARGDSRVDIKFDVVDQTFNIEVDGRFELTFSVPETVDPAALDDRARVVLTGHRSIPDRAAFHAALDDDLTIPQDTLTISLDPAAPDPNLISVETGAITISVPTEASLQTPTALRMIDAGIHPVVAELRVGGRLVGVATTFVNRLPVADAPSFGAMSIALVLGQTVDPGVDGLGAVTAPTAARAELQSLADTLAAMAAVDLGAPRGVHLQPGMLQAVAEVDPELATELATYLSESDLFAATRLPLDPSAAAAAGQQDRYTNWLREGEDLLAAFAPGTAVDRSVYLVDAEISDAAAGMHRNLGTRMMILPFEIYDRLDGSLREFTDISQLVTIGLADGSTMPAAVIDGLLAEQLASGAANPRRTAIEIASELVVLARDINADGGIVDRHGLVLALADAGVPDARLMTELMPLLIATPGLDLVEPRELGTIVDTLLNDGQLVTVALPDTAGPDLAPRLALVEDVSTDVLAHASMLPDDSPDIDRWSTMVDSFVSTALSDDQLGAMVDQLDSEFAVYRNGVVAPEPFSFTLTGRENKFRFSLTNTTNTELRVRVQLSSPKIRFPDNGQVVVLPANTSTVIVTRAEALSNGKSSVFLRVFAPAQNIELELTPEVVLTARVTSLAGLGQLITGAGLLLIITWWIHHARRTRRRQHASTNQARHPAAAGSVPPL
jgi:hypothetical protein